MKKSLFGILILLLFAGFASAQDDPGTAFKNAKKAHSRYTTSTDTEAAAEDLEAARAAIDIASAGANSLAEKELFKLWDLKGKIYNQVASNDINKAVMDQNYKPKMLNAANIAYEAYKMAMSKSEKKWQSTQVLEALIKVANNMSNAGRLMYGNGDYVSAFKTNEKLLEARTFLIDNGDDSFLKEEADYNEQIYITALTAVGAKENDKAAKYLKQLYDISYEKPDVYDQYYRALVSTNPDEAVKVLQKGRELYPEDEGLLVAEINYYLQAEKLDELVSRLKEAMKKDPTNIGYVSTLGNVYDNLYTRESEAGNDDKAKEYFDGAKEYYTKALEIDNADKTCLYNMGALYFNKAAVITKELTTLESDLSKAGIAKYNDRKAEVFVWMDKALPYFLDAEKIDANDKSTLIALREFYARKDNLEKYNEYKSRIEAIEAAGGK